MKLNIADYQDLWTARGARYRLIYNSAEEFFDSVLIFDNEAGGPLIVDAPEKIYREIIQRMKNAGVPVQTFADLDAEQSER